MQDVPRLLVHRSLPDRVVAPHIVERRIEHLVRLEAVDPQEKGAVLRIVAHPAPGGCENLGAGPIRLVTPVAHVVQVLQEGARTVQRRLRCLRHGRLVRPEVALEKLADQIPRPRPPAIPTGTANVLPRHEPAGVVHVGLEEVRGVGDESGRVALLQKDLGDGGVLVRDLVPAVVPVRKWKSAHPREAPVADLHRRPGFGEAACEPHGFGSQRVQRRRRNTAELLARAHDVGAERVDADHDDVQLVHCGDSPSRSRWPDASSGIDHGAPA